MDDQQKAAYEMAQVVCAQAEIAGMIAENKLREVTYDDAPIYLKKDFDEIINKYAIHHNGVLTLFHGGR